MPEETTIRRLKRNFDQVVRKQEENNHNGLRHIINQFNDILEDLKEETDNSRIDEIEKVEGTGYPSGGHIQDLDEIRVKILDIVEFLDLNQEDFQESSGEQLPLIAIEQSQSQSQQTSIDISFEDIQRSIEEGDFSEEEKEELSELTEQFKEEVEKDDPDTDRLKSIYDQVKTMSSDVASQLIAFAIKVGATAIVSSLL